jgi:hypothetical protein
LAEAGRVRGRTSARRSRHRVQQSPAYSGGIGETSGAGPRTTSRSLVLHGGASRRSWKGKVTTLSRDA